MSHTPLQARLGLTHPLFQAPMAGAQDHRLAIAVAQAGGLGALPAAVMTPDALSEAIQRFRAATTAPLNVNFFCHAPTAEDPLRLAQWEAALDPLYHEWGLAGEPKPRGAGRQPFSAASLEVIQTLRPEVVSFHFGLPAANLVEAVKATGALIMASATTVEEARWLEAHGVDAVIAQGLEAGGHRGHFLSDDLHRQCGLMALLPQVVAAIERPVVAAGGIASPEAVAACRALGAQAVQVGTAFLRTPEALTAPLHRAALAQANHRPTALTHLFTGRPARGLVNGLMERLGPLNPLAPAFPWATAALGPLRQHAEALGRDDATPLWAGQAAALAREEPAADVVRRLGQGWSHRP